MLADIITAVEALANALKLLVGYMPLFLLVLVLVALSILAFWSRIAVLFMVCFGLSMVCGLRWFDTFKTDDALAVSLALIFYSIVCAGLALAYVIPRKEIKEEE